MVTEKQNTWAEEYPPEKLKTFPTYLSSEIRDEHNIRINTINAACAHGIFPCTKAGMNWKIYDTPPFRAWLEGHKHRGNRGQGPKPKNKAEQEA